MVKKIALALLVFVSPLFAGTTTTRLGMNRLDIIGDDYFTEFPTNVADVLDAAVLDIRPGKTNVVQSDIYYQGIVDFTSATVSSLDFSTASFLTATASSFTVSGLLNSPGQNNLGAVSVSSAATFNGTSLFNGAATFAAPSTFSSPVSMTQGLTVASSATVTDTVRVLNKLCIGAVNCDIGEKLILDGGGIRLFGASGASMLFTDGLTGGSLAWSGVSSPYFTLGDFGGSLFLGSSGSYYDFDTTRPKFRFSQDTEFAADITASNNSRTIGDLSGATTWFNIIGSHGIFDDVRASTFTFSDGTSLTSSSNTFQSQINSNSMAISTNASAFNLYASTTAANEASNRASVSASTSATQAQLNSTVVSVSTNASAFLVFESTHANDVNAHGMLQSSNTWTAAQTFSSATAVNLNVTSTATAAFFVGNARSLTNYGVQSSSFSNTQVSIATTVYVGVATMTVTQQGGRFAIYFAYVDISNNSAAARNYTYRVTKNGVQIDTPHFNRTTNNDPLTISWHFAEASTTAGTNIFVLEALSSSNVATQTATAARITGVEF